MDHLELCHIHTCTLTVTVHNARNAVGAPPLANSSWKYLQPIGFFCDVDYALEFRLYHYLVLTDQFLSHQCNCRFERDVSKFWSTF